MVTSGTATITSGDTFVAVTHTYGDDDFVVQYEPQTNLAGRDVWISDKTASTFKINISSADSIDHVFGWAITLGVQEAQTPESGQYCVLANILAMPDVPGSQELNFTLQANYESYVSRLIDRASRHIDRYTRRPTAFFNGGATITEYQNGNQSSSEGIYPETARASKLGIKDKVYRLKQSPVISVTSVHQNTAAIGET